MKLIETVAELSALASTGMRGAVFTMGALHEGHASLIRRCREEIGVDGQLVVTIFVNPTQFGDPRDLELYPRTLDQDLEVCRASGADIVFVPTVAEMYPADSPVSNLSAGEIGTILEGESRPGHFDAVATVVHRLMEITKPQVTCFGEKDFQQLVVVQQMVSAQGIGCRVVPVPTVREADGLAMSSRNVRLSIAGRKSAAVLFSAMHVVQQEFAQGHPLESAVNVAKALLAEDPAISLDYLVVRDEQLNTVPMDLRSTSVPLRVLIAAYVDGVRLIDNLSIGATSQ